MITSESSESVVGVMASVLVLSSVFVLDESTKGVQGDSSSQVSVEDRVYGFNYTVFPLSSDCEGVLISTSN